MTTESPPPAPAAIRLARPDEIRKLSSFLIRGRAHVSGCRDRAVFMALIKDSLGAAPRTTVAVATDAEGVITAALLAVNGDLRRYYRTLALHHPLAAAGLLRHRLRKLPARLMNRRRARAAEPGGNAAHRTATKTLADEPRLQQPPRPADGPGPHAHDRGPHIAFCLYVLVGADHRGAGLGKAIVAASLRHLRAVGATRYDCSFSPADTAAGHLYLSMPFDIQRFPAGYFASIDLAQIEAEELPRWA